MQQNSSGQHDTLIYADIGSSSLNKKAKHAITLRPDDMDDRVEYAVLNHSPLQQPIITTNQDSTAGNIIFFAHVRAITYDLILIKMILLTLTLY